MVVSEFEVEDGCGFVFSPTLRQRGSTSLGKYPNFLDTQKKLL